MPFLLLDSLIHTSTGMYAGILSVQSLISMLLYTDVQKYDLSLLDSSDWNLCPILKTQHEKLIMLPTKKNMFNLLLQ